jgi:Co/Zn/Cd efflux system component
MKFDAKDVLTVWIGVMAIYMADDIIKKIGWDQLPLLIIKWPAVVLLSFFIVLILVEIIERTFNKKWLNG